jgi:glycosyltransferase involved in cell wall biosynthesis
VTLGAVAKLAPELPNITFDIVGGGDQRRNLEQTVQRLGIQDRVTFHGRVDEEELRASYGKADVFAIASIAELQSIATMEAMASGLPSSPRTPSLCRTSCTTARTATCSSRATSTTSPTSSASC